MHRTGKALWITLAIIVVLLAAVGLFFVFRGDAQPTADEGRAVAERFLEKMRAGDAAAAWESTSAEFKSAEGKEAFLRATAPVSYLREPLTFQSAEKSEVGSSVRTELVYTGQSGAKVKLLLGKEFGEWKVERLEHSK